MGLSEKIKTATVKNNPVIWDVLFFVAFGLVIATRVLLFLEINIDHLDSDQPFMWSGTKDYSRGIFMEPRFYGQDYNTFMEGLFAVPLIWLGVPLYYAVPSSTHFISLFPFLFTAFYLYRHNKKPNALLVLLVLLCLTPAYDIMNCLPRGFVTGVFFGAFFIISLINPGKTGWMLFNFCMAGLGLVVNPNSLLVSAPFVLFMFLHHYKSVRFYVYSFIALVFFYAAHFFFDHFYEVHPDYVVYGIQTEISPSFFLRNLGSINDLFAHINFFTVRFGGALFLYVGILALALWKNERRAFWALQLLLLLIVITFFSGKMQDGKPWPYYSHSRMYLAVPLLFCLLLSFVSIRPGRLFLLVALFSLCFGAYKVFNVKKAVAHHTRPEAWFGVHLVSLKQARQAMGFYKDMCKKKEAGFFLVSNGFWLNTFLCYGGPALHDDFPPTQETNSERRYWVRQQNQNKVYRQFIYLSASYTFHEGVPATPGFELEVIDGCGMYLVKNNTLPLGEFIKITRKVEYGI